MGSHAAVALLNVFLREGRGFVVIGVVVDDADKRLTVAQIEKRATPKALWIAKTVLRREATVLCPHCLDVDDEPVPISDPCEDDYDIGRWKRD